MSAKSLALTAIATQLILGLILVAILFTLQGGDQTVTANPGPIHVVVDTIPSCDDARNTMPTGYGCTP